MAIRSNRPAGSGARLTAVLGPTNTGKTHLAIDRMLGHSSGMIGFPLRLLARENYDRAASLRGRRQVALITGEEKIVPPGARYFFCTVESMPVDRQVEFLAVDEIQLCGDPERGHVFTDRLLYARGIAETMFLGSDTIAPLLRRLIPEASVVSRPRFSTLRFAGEKKITRLPRRSAVVAFSAADVYALAELLRRQRGGTAVVLGALSPRTRNAQVELFESGEVDYLVATDAIGMGLNLNLDHVAFASLRKFDGRAPRRLTASEIGQIAGRAGRHMSDGSFGTVAGADSLDAAEVEAIENHRFDPLRSLFWRCRDFDFRSPQALLASLEQAATRRELLRARSAEDQAALASLARDPEVAALAQGEAAVRLLWEVCQVPDFRKILTDQHVRLLKHIYCCLMRGERRLPEDWVAARLQAIDRTEGDIEALVARIAAGRTWTFIAHRNDWLDNAQHWQERTRAMEDRLSDALHDRLTQRFVDRRTALLMRRLSGGEKLLGGVRAGGEVVVEGERIGELRGFRFKPERGGSEENARATLSAARRVMHEEIPARVRRFENDDDGAFSLDPDGLLLWRGAPVARLAAGDSPLRPEVQAFREEFLDGPSRERIRRRLLRWLERYLRNRLAPLFALEQAELQGASRGLAFQLVEALGSLPRQDLAPQIGHLTKTDRKRLSALGIRLGAESVFLPALLKPESMQLRARLWANWSGVSRPNLPPPGGLLCRPEGRESFYLALGFRRFASRDGDWAVRVDALERLVGALHRMAPRGPFSPTEALAAFLGGDRAALTVLLPALGYRIHRRGNPTSFTARRARKPIAKKRSRRAQRRPEAGKDSPFAALRTLTGGDD